MIGPSDDLPTGSPEFVGGPVVTATVPYMPRLKPARWSLWCWLFGHQYAEHYEPPFDPSFKCFRCRREISDHAKLRRRDETARNQVTLAVFTTPRPGQHTCVLKVEERFTAAGVRAFVYGEEPPYGVHRPC